ncbi:MAG: 3-phosphoshikimate 1-carboxyvinyltransferase [Chlamydiae bacterium]|nr:3-phosphoshikimate 1-carboxyvinyltransferase [Chlamydiota bacterium]
MLDKLHKRVDAIDDQILSLLDQRMIVTRKIASVKNELELPLKDTGRELAITKRLQKLAKHPLLADAISSIFSPIFDCAKAERKLMERKEISMERMSKFVIKPGNVRGEVAIPPSKSHTLRGILFASLARGKSLITNPLESPDATAMVKACKMLGAGIEREGRDFAIKGVGGKISSEEHTIDAGNSGLVLRLIVGIAALGRQPIVITGDHSICNQRPMGPMLDALQQLGVRAESVHGNGYAPLIVQGPLQGGQALISGEDSQPISALLMAGSLCPKGLKLKVTDPGEKPWIDMTLHWLRRLGTKVEHDSYTQYDVAGGTIWDGFTYNVPGDWSSAAFPLAAALVTGSELTIHNVCTSDCQGDKAIVEILQRMGAVIEVRGDSLIISPSGKLKGVEVDLNDCIDAIPILSVVACYASGTTRITNTSVAKTKECNRIACIASELKKMGAQILETEDGLIIRGAKLHGAEVESHRDHRMAMSLTVAALGATGATTVNDVACVSKTYGSFAESFQKMGANIEVMQ